MDKSEACRNFFRLELGVTKIQVIGMVNSLIKAEDSAGGDRRRKSWWVQPGRTKPVKAEPDNASWPHRLARPERTLRLEEVPEDIGAKPHGRGHCPTVCLIVSRAFRSIDGNLAYLRKHLTTCLRSRTVCWSTN